MLVNKGLSVAFLFCNVGAKELNLKGDIVISAGLFGQVGDSEVWEGMEGRTLT